MNNEDKKIFDKYNEIINRTAEKEELEHQKKALKEVCSSIITKLYQSSGGMPGGMPRGSCVVAPPTVGASSRFTIEECKLEYQACVLGKQISVKCEGRCPCPSDKSTSTSRNVKRACSDLEFREVANRLRDWFKALHESGSQNKKTKALLRPERSRFDTSILPICKDSLGWMFNRLDTNYDLLLDQSELGSIYLDKNEQCTKAFFNSCDTYKDSLISNNEWCYCFQRQQDPPCQTELSNIQKRRGVKKLLGQYIPLCDEDGYYKPTQCHGSVGQCWCVDRYGNEVMGSRTNGVADCALNPVARDPEFGARAHRGPLVSNKTEFFSECHLVSRQSDSYFSATSTVKVTE
ncbi:hypothetical protein PANDA_010247 [Ailuropoda melanoleuca]|uniref:Thyroglobulin type-1 domain-containing protein n=1 Tax=Ailuropoda melanoleuca TaxID=9646 RepID=D2HGS2_AILME|nr:hypothetical protein PANDA_010247 [Ailuropoda melanoleuca]